MSINVLFVCLGNICRSPAAEGAFKHLVEEEELLDQIHIDSAGTSAFHSGEKADSRMRSHAKKRGLNLTSRARQFIASDFEDFDYIICMDGENFKNVSLLDRSSQYKNKVFMMTEFSIERSENFVPDPYYGGEEGFEQVLDIVQDCSKGLLERIKRDLNG